MIESIITRASHYFPQQCGIGVFIPSDMTRGHMTSRGCPTHVGAGTSPKSSSGQDTTAWYTLDFAWVAHISSSTDSSTGRSVRSPVTMVVCGAYMEVIEERAIIYNHSPLPSHWWYWYVDGMHNNDRPRSSGCCHCIGAWYTLPVWSPLPGPILIPSPRC